MVKIITGLFFLNTIFQSNMEFCKVLFRTEGVEKAYPQLSNDSKNILYQSNATGKWQLFITDLTDNNKVELTKDNYNNYFANWSADNEWITFVSDRDGNEEIYLMRNSGKEMKRLTNDKGSDIHPYFSPDGKSILFNSTRGNGSYDIYRYTIKTGVTERLTFTMEDENYARYSPDMKKIVYIKSGKTGDDLFVMNITSKVNENITNTPETIDNWPTFDKNGNWIYFTSMSNGSQCIFKMKPDGSDLKQVTYPMEEDEQHARVFVSEDNKKIIFNKKVGKTIEIWEYSLDPS